MRSLFGIIFLFLLCLQTAFAVDSPSEIKIVATTSIIGDWVSIIGGDKIQVTILVGPDADVHNFDPSPDDARKLLEASLIFENGLDLEFWLDSLYSSAESKAKRITLSDSIKKIPLTSHHCHKHHCSENEYDPHVWLSIQNAKIMVGVICDALIKIDKDNEIFYKTRCEKYLKQLSDLDLWIRKMVSHLPKQKRLIITNHNTFEYFAREYDFTIVGSILGSSNTTDMDPSAKSLSQIITQIKKHNIKAIFSENIESRVLVDEVAKESGLKKPQMLYTGALSNKKGPASDYYRMMKYNVETLVTNLNQ